MFHFCADRRTRSSTIQTWWCLSICSTSVVLCNSIDGAHAAGIHIQIHHAWPLIYLFVVHVKSLAEGDLPIAHNNLLTLKLGIFFLGCLWWDLNLGLLSARRAPCR